MVSIWILTLGTEGDAHESIKAWVPPYSLLKNREESRFSPVFTGGATR